MSIPDGRPIHGLDAFSSACPDARSILENSALTGTEAANEINALATDAGLNFSTSKRAVNRWRADHRIVSTNPHNNHKPKLAELLDPQTPGAKSVKAPNWNVGIDLDVLKGEAEIRTRPQLVTADQPAVGPDESRILAEFGLSADEWTVAAYRESRWEGGIPDQWLSAHRVSVKKRDRLAPQIDPAATEAILSKYQGKVVTRRPKAGRSLLVVIADTQAAKPEGGGIEALTERLNEGTEQIRQRIENEFGGHLDKLVLALGGDLVEHCTASGGLLPLQVEAVAAIRYMRRMIVHVLATLSPYARETTVISAPGNHGRVKTATVGLSPTDNFDLECTIGAADMLSMNPRFDSISWVYPDQGEPWAVANVGSEDVPLRLCVIHGDQARPEKFPEWVNKMAGGMEAPGFCTAYVTGHYHNLQIRSLNGKRVWLQAPSCDGDSAWYRHKTAANSPSGIVSAELVPGSPMPIQAAVLHIGAVSA